MKKAVYISRLVFAGIFFILTVLAFLEFAYGIKTLNITPVLIRNFSVLAVIFLVSATIITFVFGRIGCSLICPFGIFQDFLCQFRQEAGEYRKSLPYKYVILALTTVAFIFGFKYIKLWFADFSGLSMGLTIGLIVFLVLLVVLTVFKQRFFCTDICPCGALLGLISKFSLFKMNTDKDECIYCGMCERNCPSGCIDINNDYINNETCVKCLKCTTVCPKGAMNYEIKHK